jgi:DNA-binding response OmpR family regulator
VLVVDDDPAIGRILRIKLGACGYEVLTSATGEEAIERVRSGEPDIVLLDVVMPGVSGLEVLQRVRAFSRVPAVVFTGHPDIIRIARALGADGALAKPFDPDFLVETIESTLRTAGRDDGARQEDPAG